MENGKYRHTVRELYDFIQSRLYFNRPDLQVGGEQFNSTLLFTLLTALTGGKALIIGSPGRGRAIQFHPPFHPPHRLNRG
jgi:hypothetical protein